MISKLHNLFSIFLKKYMIILSNTNTFTFVFNYKNVKKQYQNITIAVRVSNHI